MHTLEDRGQYVDRRKLLKELEKEGLLCMEGAQEVAGVG